MECLIHAAEIDPNIPFSLANRIVRRDNKAMDSREFIRRAMIYAYPCELTPDEDGGLVATFPDVPQAITGGKDRAEARAMAEDALATALAAYVHAQWEIPTPGQPVAGQELVAVPTVVAAKLALYSAMREQRISNAELASRLAISESTVQKLIDPERNSPIV